MDKALQRVAKVLHGLIIRNEELLPMVLGRVGPEVAGKGRGRRGLRWGGAASTRSATAKWSSNWWEVSLDGWVVGGSRFRILYGFSESKQ